MKFFNSILVIIFLIICSNSTFIFSQKKSLRSKIQQIIESSDGKVGVAIIGLGNNDTLFFNGTDKFPMQSIYKFHLALSGCSG